MSFANTEIYETLQRVFGFQNFRANQEEVVKSILQGRDVMSVMPTGSGKSLCYQLPAKLLEGAAVVISPLIALMKDQVDAARENGIAAEFLNSSMTPDEMGYTLHLLRSGKIELLYIAPERFAAAGFMRALQSVKISLFAIDEAHCISEWGHDFRPDYLNLSVLTRTFSGVPVAAFTATATVEVQRDIIDKIGLRDPHIVRASFNRPNLVYEVRRKRNLGEELMEFLESRRGESGIVYRTTRLSVEETAAFLKSNGVNAAPYHAGLEQDDRRLNQERFKNGEIDVIVATIAFGMGIDKPDIRFVVHGDLPKNIENYYQETGRAGRDGEQAHCLLLYGGVDVSRIRFLLSKIENEVAQAVALDKLEQVNHYASVNVCRRRQLLNYFSEEYPEKKCGACDICLANLETADVTTDARKLLSAAAETYERFGAAYIVDIVTGAKTQRIRDYGHDRLTAYGSGSDRKKQYWRTMIDELIAQGLAIQEGEYPVFKMTRKGRELVLGQGSFEIALRRETPAPARAKTAVDSGPYDRRLFERLRDLRAKLARERNEPPYRIFHDKALYQMCQKLPKTDGDFLTIDGVGEAKLNHFGPAFLETIRLHVEGKFAD